MVGDYYSVRYSKVNLYIWIQTYVVHSSFLFFYEEVYDLGKKRVCKNYSSNSSSKSLTSDAIEAITIAESGSATSICPFCAFCTANTS